MKVIKNSKIDIEEIEQYIKNSSKNSKIYIAGDSKPSRNGIIYVICVIVHNIDSFGIGRGAKIFREATRVNGRRPSIKEKLMKEVELVIEVATVVEKVLGGRTFEIHLDLSNEPENKSNEVVKAAMGWIFGMFGFYPKIKPIAIHASNTADHYTKPGNVHLI